MTEPSVIRSHLERRFDAHRLVFWHDPAGEYADGLDSLGLDDVQIVRVANDEYAVKYRVLRDESEKNFLVYRSGTIPTGIGNWLLDLELAYGVFTADRASLVQQDLGLSGDGIAEVVQGHEEFFKATKRVEQLKALLDANDDARRLQAKMSAVLLGQREHSLMEITRTLLIENANGADEKYNSLAAFGLDIFHWQGVGSIYGYTSASPSVDDFVLWIFRQAITRFQSDPPGGFRNIQLDFASFRNDRRSGPALSVLARRAARDLNYAGAIEGTDLRTLVDIDLFEEIDRKIISDLARGVVDRTIPAREVADVIRRRQTSIWIDGYRKLYSAIGSASDLLTRISGIDFAMQSFDDGLELYRNEWFRIDQLYRQFWYATRTAEHPGPLEELRTQVESFYANKFLYALGTAWQQQVDIIDRWRSSVMRSQSSFFTSYVAPITKDGRRKAVVIVSDALRYEIADELGSRVRQEDRFDADLDALLGVLPSYTQLGMAALLPHITIGHSGKGDLVDVDGQPTSGVDNRGKVLAAVQGTAILAENLLAMTREEIRDLYQQHQILYVYHNRIDATGDKHGTERQVFEAAERTLQELVELVKRLANANATNILVTADHGFLFQDSGLDETGYLSVSPHGDNIAFQARRYVLGTGLKPDLAFKTFTPAQLGLASDFEVQIPKSIHRLRLKGSGARFVHGGAALQEVVVPVLVINKKRTSDVRLVNVEILPESDRIATGQLVVRLFQSEPVSDKVQARTLRAGLYVGETLISNHETLIFDQESPDARDRYQKAVMLLSQAANEYNNRVVEFRLEELIPKTSQWRVHAKAIYALRRSFATDF